MKLSRNWLEDYIDLSSVSNAELENWITTRIAEVDSLETLQEPMEDAIVALVKDVQALAHSKKLFKVLVEIGSGKEAQVVCGATNCRVGMFTAYVPPQGKILVGGKLVEITEREVAGVLSCGVLVAEDELGLTNEHSGILDLSLVAGGRNLEAPAPVLKPGDKLKDIYGGADVIFEIDNKSLTHRPDLWCHFGFAREIAAILHKPLKKNINKYLDDSPEGQLAIKQLVGAGVSEYQVQIASATPCSRFMAVEIIKAKNEISPLWLRRRLQAIGAGVRTILVDLSNYVMHDVGQPNHAYDADRLVGKKLTARMATVGEIFKALDGASYELSPEDMVIADEQGIVGLAGIMGGERSSIYETTNHLFLESACFDAVTVRLSAKRHGIRTDASNRFEKSRSPFAAALAILRFVEIFLKLQPEAQIVSRVCDEFPNKPERKRIEVSGNYVRSRLGVEISDETIEQILTGLSFKVTRGSAAELSVEIPCERATKDISIADDLVEEVGRIYGYENIQEAAPQILPQPAESVKIKEFEYLVGSTLVARGFSEIYNYSFMSGSLAQKLGYDVRAAIKLKNAVDETTAHLRTSLIPNMFSAVEQNYKHEQELYIFEIGRTYEKDFDLRHLQLKFRDQYQTFPTTFERRLVCLVYSSGRDEKELGCLLKPAVAQGADFYALAATVQNLVWLSTEKPVCLEPLAQGDSAYVAWMHPYRSARVVVNGVDLGFIAEARIEAFEDVRERVVFAELDLELLMEVDVTQKMTKALPKFPDSFFELAVIMPEHEPYRNLEQLFWQKAQTKLLRRIEPLSVYTGQPLADGTKSVAVKFYFGSDDRTLAREEIEELQSSFMNVVKASQYSLR
ncbi:MAG: phenylalanine--tRNA ligase subunit beta [Deltaproteobacteria bacterium]|jgi:phenylalanyl-tRNA synthetase beta chain|nr:phenylalanine--tRNA ligase subunit beta [Deltaproteobacteria bacterium]